MKTENFISPLNEERQVNGGLTCYAFQDFDIRTMLEFMGGKLTSRTMGLKGHLAFGRKRLAATKAGPLRRTP